DVTLIRRREITAAVRFRGGATTTLTLPRPLTAQQLRATHEDVRRQIDALLHEYTDAQVARILNESGLRTGAGDVFDTASVQWVRYSTKLKSLKERLLDGGMITKKQLSAMLGVCRTTIGKLRRQGRLKARICNDQGEWLYWPPEQISRLHRPNRLNHASHPLQEMQYEKRSFEVDRLLCRCGAEMKIVSFITDPRVVDRILRYLESPACSTLNPFPPPPPRFPSRRDGPACMRGITPSSWPALGQ